LVIILSGVLYNFQLLGLPITIASLPNKMADEFLLPIHSNWILGGFLLASAFFLLAVLYIVQVKHTQTSIPYHLFISFAFLTALYISQGIDFFFLFVSFQDMGH
jgi:hypothetical protein